MDLNNLNPNNGRYPMTQSSTYYSALRAPNNLGSINAIQEVVTEPVLVVNNAPIFTTSVSYHFPQPQAIPQSPVHSMQKSIVSQYKSRSRIYKLGELQENRLDESVWQSVAQEFKSMWGKLKHVIIPSFDGAPRQELRNWDLWGPLFICLAIGLVWDDPNQLFILILVTFAGGMLVTFNSRVLGGRVSFLQSVSILGYCVFPLLICSCLAFIMGLLKLNYKALTILYVGVGVAWCILSSRTFLLANIPPGREFLAMYPVFLFYIFLGTFTMFM